jgi:hypothetical protein
LVNSTFSRTNRHGAGQLSAFSSDLPSAVAALAFFFTAGFFAAGSAATVPALAFLLAATLRGAAAFGSAFAADFVCALDSLAAFAFLAFGSFAALWVDLASAAGF